LKKDKEPVDIPAYLDMIGSYLANVYKSKDQKFIKGEIAVFLGARNKDGNKGIKHIYGTNANPDFKERVCEEAMNILLNDESIELSQKFTVIDDQINEDIDMEI